MEKRDINKIIESYEKYRKELSRYLHDNISSDLIAIKLHLSLLKNDAEFENNKDYILGLVEKTYYMVRKIMDEAHPGEMVLDNLKGAIKEKIYSYKKLNENLAIYYSYEVEESIIISENIKITLYRIVSEALSNMQKYSESTECIVRIESIQNQLIVLIDDNGKGFDIHTVKRGRGLDNIEAYINALNGTIEIESQINEGTTYNIVVPLI